ncbi:uncharacterized protein LOC124264165 isoform X2 [Haliotis rubra]|uniref:uncharacterized protein LOC124264165 isoform X2 n=1 Tax=Haliotis rubra TaxID=36100 RepID=UPI001EE627F3|nr:uncharacterized protein LOC124264165 isoform X2 [Haliotis rubra]
MERDFGLKCLWPKRDFKPGRDLGSLIQEGIVCSMKVVFVMTPEAVESGWCDMKFLVPEVKNREKRAEQLNGRMVQIRGEQVFKSCMGPAWWFSSLDQHQRYQLRQLGSKFAERTYYEARDVINKSFRMKYFSIFSSCWRCCSWCFIGLVLWFLLVAFIVALIHTKQNHLFDATFMWFGIFPGLLAVQITVFFHYPKIGECMLYHACGPLLFSCQPLYLMYLHSE